MTNQEWGRDALGDRMKAYEDQYRVKLPKRQFVMVRLDGKAFHSFTKGFDRPWDTRLVRAMQATTNYLCQKMGGAVLGYSQSDEISILLAPGAKLTSEPWFDNNLQKIVSVSASMCTSFFNEVINFNPRDTDMQRREANFDSRAFILPEDEVVNYFIWRQQDATRNSVQMMARSLFSHAECTNKNTHDLMDMIVAKGQNWNSVNTDFKRGACCKKESYSVPVDPKWRQSTDAETVDRSIWTTDLDTPIFTQARSYVTNTFPKKEVE